MSEVSGKTHEIVPEAAENEAPDFQCRGADGREFGVEVTVVYYSSQAAVAAWDSTPTYVTVMNPNSTLAEGLNLAIAKKAKNDYGRDCILAIHLDAPLTTIDEFEATVLPSVRVVANKFSSVFCRLKAPAGKPYESVWWKLHPEAARYYEEPRSGSAGGAAP
jgi:hypothetical protein